MGFLKTVQLLLTFVLFTGAALAQSPSARSAASQKVELSVLYAGVEGSPRAKEFVPFFKKYFTKVGVAPYSEFTPDMAEGYDVVVFDAAIHPAPGKSVRSPMLPNDWDRATVLISGGGGFIAMGTSLKLDWL